MVISSGTVVVFSDMVDAVIMSMAVEDSRRELLEVHPTRNIVLQGELKAGENQGTCFVRCGGGCVHVG